MNNTVKLILQHFSMTIQMLFHDIADIGGHTKTGSQYRNKPACFFIQATTETYLMTVPDRNIVQEDTIVFGKVIWYSHFFIQFSNPFFQ